MDAAAMSVAAVVLFALLGLLAGVAHFSLLRRNVALWVGGGSSLAAAALPIVRMALTVAVLVLAARQGWPALLACALGITCARIALVRRAGARRP
jgi:hypothetical protein